MGDEACCSCRVVGGERGKRDVAFPRRAAHFLCRVGRLPQWEGDRGGAALYGMHRRGSGLAAATAIFTARISRQRLLPSIRAVITSETFSAYFRGYFADTHPLIFTVISRFPFNVLFLSLLLMSDFDASHLCRLQRSIIHRALQSVCLQMDMPPWRAIVADTS